MQIKQLPEYSGTPTDNSVFALDDNTHAYKLTFASLAGSVITSVTATLNGATQTVKGAIDAIGTSLKKLTDAITITNNGTVRISGGSLVNEDYSITSGSSTKSGEARINVQTSARTGRIVASQSTSYTGFYDVDNSKYVIYSDAAGIVRVNNYGSTARPPVCSNGTDGNRVDRFSASSGNLAVYMQLNGAGSVFDQVNYPTSLSDERLKKNILPCEASGVDLVNSLDVVSFDWTNRPEHWDFGIIAQAAREIDNNLVVGDEGEGYLSINTPYLVNVLLKAVQELSAEVEALKND